MGEVFAGRFELLDPVAAGGMGEVWTARDLRDDQVVAVKLLRQADAGGLLRFMREQGLRIHHPHVMTPLAWAGMDDRVLFSMPLATGGSVATLVGDYGPLPVRYAAELLRQLLDGLRAVHAAGVVHRDVKPANLLLDATGHARPRLRLSDFGVALPLDGPRLTVLASTIGTPGYLAPEQAGSDPSPAADLYAVGQVGKELLTGLRPGTGDDDAPTLPPDSAALWQVLQRLTAEDPATRPSLDEARGFLTRPEYAWVEQDEIEVFRVVVAEPDQRPTPPATTMPSAARTTAPAPAIRPAADVARPPRRSLVAPLALVVAGAVVLLAVLLYALS